MTPTEAYMGGQLRPTHPALLAEYEQESAAAVAALQPALDIAYGPHPRQRFDVFQSPLPWRGTLAYFHAGYWQSRDKSQFRFLATSFAPHGIDVAMVNYPLCPDVTLAALVDATRTAIPALLAHAATRGRGGTRLVASGHSAGGHIAVELALTQWSGTSPITGVAALSGVFDLTPLLPTPLNDRLRLDATTARAASPVYRVRPGMPPALFAVGGGGTQAFLDQTAQMHAAWTNAGNRAIQLVVPDADHFSLLRHVQQPGLMHTHLLDMFAD